MRSLFKILPFHRFHPLNKLSPIATPKRYCGVLSILVCFGLLASAQQNNPQRDASAITLLTQAVTAAGGSDAIGAIQDFTASGTITHFWGDNPEQGQLTVKARGLTQFRLDSIVPDGTWSMAVNNGTGQLVFPDGTVTPTAYHNNLNAGSLTWPIFNVNTAILDATTTVLDLGVVQFGSGQAHQIRIQQNLQGDPTGSFSRLTKRDYFFDPSSFLLMEVQDTQHPNDDMVNGALTHKIDFGNYQTVNGLLVPFSVSESVTGQQTWQIQLSSVAFNTGLSDSDFQF